MFWTIEALLSLFFVINNVLSIMGHKFMSVASYFFTCSKILIGLLVITAFFMLLANTVSLIC